jgi:hypothetical protein
MRLIAPLLLLLVSPCLFGQVKISSKHFKIIEASQHKWTPGVAQENAKQVGGLIYEIKLRVKKKGSLQFDQFISEGKALGIEVTRDSERNAKGPFNKGDVLTLIARTDVSQAATVPDQVLEEYISKAKQKPGWIVYSFKEKKYMAGISVIEEKVPNQLSRYL